MFTHDDLVHSYTRAQALADGVLVDATEMAREAGFKVPVALTTAVYEGCVAWSEHDELAKSAGQSVQGRLWDVLCLAYRAARRTDGDRAPFSVYRISREGSSLEPSKVDLVLMIHPGDAGEAVCTVMVPGED